MKFPAIYVALMLWMGCCSAGAAMAGIRVENESHSTLHVFLKGVADKNFRGPYSVPPRGKTDINVPPGKYWVATQHPDKTFDYLGWQDYSDHKITYRVSLCNSCRYVRPGEKVAPPPQVFTASVHHADEYKCQTCGQMHRRWVPGWKSGDVRSGRVNDQGEMLDEHLFDYRLGVSVIDGQNGVIVTQALDDSPSRKLHVIDGNPAKTYYLEAGTAVITSVNGKPTPNTTEFIKLLEESPHRVELTVSNTRATVTKKYWTDLSK